MSRAHPQSGLGRVGLARCGSGQRVSHGRVWKGASLDCSGALEGGPPPGRAASSAGTPHELAFGSRTAHPPGLGSSPREEIRGRGQARSRAGGGVGRGCRAPGRLWGSPPCRCRGVPAAQYAAATRTGARAVRSQQPPQDCSSDCTRGWGTAALGEISGSATGFQIVFPDHLPLPLRQPPTFGLKIRCTPPPV